MADVNNRDEKEAEIARFLGREFGKFRAMVIAAIPELFPGINDLPQDMYAGHTTSLNAGLTPLLQGVFMEQAQTFIDEFDFLGVEWGLINESAAQWAREYTFDLVTNLTDTSRRTLQKLIPQFFEEQMTQGQLREMLAPTFGPVRAEMIARTEVTRAAAQGEEATAAELEKQGIFMAPIWLTRMDEIVCVICGPLNNQKAAGKTPSGRPYWIHPVTKQEYTMPAHPRCRCSEAHEIIPLP